LLQVRKASQEALIQTVRTKCLSEGN